MIFNPKDGLVLEINQSTVVTFPTGNMGGTSPVLGVIRLPNDLVLGASHALIVAETPFHPVDHRWPDQPGDTGVIEVNGSRLRVADCFVGALADGSHEVLVNSSIPARRGEPGWHWLVLHVLAGDVAEFEGGLDGSQATLIVDEPRRRQLSAAHTACHLSGFALNAALRNMWRKAARNDSLGNPDFDGLALEKSTISTDGFRDVYRMGRSLRKQGFDLEQMPEMITCLAADISRQISSWTTTGAPIRVKEFGRELASAREWECGLPQGIARVACGGTHPPDLRAISDVEITANLTGAGVELRLSARVKGRPNDEPYAVSSSEQDTPEKRYAGC